MKWHIVLTCIIISVLLFIAALLVMGISGCGASPYLSCNNATTQACYDDDGDGISESIVVCDGVNWLPIMDCKEQWNPDGDLVPGVCVMNNGNAICVQEKSWTENK